MFYKPITLQYSVAKLDKLSVPEVKLSRSRLKFAKDWQKADRSLNQILLPFEHSTFAASASSGPSIHVRQDNNSLLVRGTTVDKVAKKTDTLGSDHLASADHVKFTHGTAYGLTEILSFFSSGIFLAQELDDYPTNEGSLDVALRTFLRGPPSVMIQSQMISVQEGVRAFFSRAQLGMELAKEKEEREPNIETMLMRAREQEPEMVGLVSAGMLANQRCFCITEKGFFGLVPGKVEIGDEVAVFNGGNVPFILRRFELGNEQELVYRLVGDGYFHGLMHGEAQSLDTYDERDLVIV